MSPSMVYSRGVGRGRGRSRGRRRCGGEQQHPAYGGRGGSTGGRGGGRAPTGFVWPPPGPSTPLPAALFYQNPASTGPHVGGAYGSAAAASFTPSPTCVSAAAPAPTADMAPPAGVAVAASQAGQPEAKKAPEVDLAPVSKSRLAHAARPGANKLLDKTLFSSSKEADRTDKMGKGNYVSRAVAGDDTALLLSAVESFRKVSLGWLRKGSEASRILEQEMSTRLLHLACRHDAVECARFLLDGGHGIMVSPVDARDQMMRTPLHAAAESHSVSCIELLLSRNARTDLRVVDGRPVLALEVALLSRSVQFDWSLEDSVEDILPYLQQKDLQSVRLLAEKTWEVGEVAYRCAIEGRVIELAMLLLVAEDKISDTVSVVIDGVRTKRSIYSSIVDEVMSIGDASAKDNTERRKALLCEIQLLNQFRASSWRDPNIARGTFPPLPRAAKAGDVNGADPEGNTALLMMLNRKERPIDVATSPDICFVLNSANWAQLNNGPLENNDKMKKRSPKDLLDDDFNERKKPKTSQDFPSNRFSAQRAQSKMHSCRAQSNCQIDQDGVTVLLDSPVGRFSFEISLNKPVSALKNLFKEQTGLSILNTRLRMGGKLMADNEVLGFYGLSNNSVVDLSVKLLGGAPTNSPLGKRKRTVEQPYTLETFADDPPFQMVVTSRVRGNNGKLTDELTPGARRMAASIEAIFKLAFLARRTWGGLIQLSDFSVSNGEAILEKPASPLRDNEVWENQLRLDCMAHASIIFKLFMQDEKKPPYMEYVYIQMVKVKSKWLKPGLDWFPKFVRTSLSYMPSNRRLHAPIDAWRYYEQLESMEDKKKFENVVNRVKVPGIWKDYEINEELFPQFMPTLLYYFNKHKVLYPKTAFGCFLFTRNYGVHNTVLEYKYSEVALPTVLKDFVAMVIRKLIKHGYPIADVLEDE